MPHLHRGIMNPRLEPLLRELERLANELGKRTITLRARLNAHDTYLKTGASTLPKGAG